jgi:hypothetical protein
MDLHTALENILDGMLLHVSSVAPRVPNPVNPAEDFADKWKDDARLERNFRLWHQQAKADLAHLFSAESATALASQLHARFRVSAEASALADVYSAERSSRAAAAAPVIIRDKGPRPWGDCV